MKQMSESCDKLVNIESEVTSSMRAAVLPTLQMETVSWSKSWYLSMEPVSHIRSLVIFMLVGSTAKIIGMTMH